MVYQGKTFQIQQCLITHKGEKMEHIAELKNLIAKANSLYNKNVEGLISLDEESVDRLNLILTSLNEEIETAGAIQNIPGML